MKAALLVAASLAVVIALLFARPHPTPGPPMRDFEAYYAAGSVWNAGGDPYSQTIWTAERSLTGVDAVRYEALPFIGPPATLPVFGLIARIPFDTANAIWRALLIAALAAVALLTLRFSERPLTPASFCAIAVAALGFGPLTSALALGQIALPAFVFVLLAMQWPAAMLFAWIQPNLGVALLSQTAPSRKGIAVAVSALMFAAICLLVSGASGLARYVGDLQAHSAAERFSAIQITLPAIAYGFGATPLLAVAIGLAATCGAIACWAFFMREGASAVERLSFTCALLPLALPFFHEHDLLIVFVPAILYALRTEGAWWFVGAFGACFAATDWLGLAQRPDGTVQTLLLIGALGAALVAMHERPRAGMLLVPACMLLFIGTVSILAHAHPAPVWPDAMRALPPNVQSLTIAGSWAAQQHATGLFDVEPVWAALRALSLLGCALTAIAVYASSRYPARSRSPLPVRA